MTALRNATCFGKYLHAHQMVLGASAVGVFVESLVVMRRSDVRFAAAPRHAASTSGLMAPP